MDRQIVYPASIPLDTDILGAQRDSMIALGYLAQMTLGTSTVVDGLVCSPTSPASLSVTVGPGCILQNAEIDGTAFGSLPALTNPLVKLGINIGATAFSLAAPQTAGTSVCYLIEASFLETDAVPVVLPYYNAANPAMPFSGPGNTGEAQNTQRQQTVQLQAKPGTASQTGTQTVPSVDAGWVGLWIVTVPAGVSAIDQSMIARYPTAPFVPQKLPQLTPGAGNLASFDPATEATWTVPPGVNLVKLRLWGGGGAGGGGVNGTAGGGGGGGGYAEGYVRVTPGDAIVVSVGSGGAGLGSAGGTTSFGAFASASGGGAGGSGASGTPGGGGGGGGAGSASGALLCIVGSPGGVGFNAGGSWLSGPGGCSFAGAGAVSVTQGNGVNGAMPGAGGSGGVGGAVGGFGGDGLALIEW